MRGVELILALSRTKSDMKMLAGGSVEFLSASEAIAVVRDRPEFVGSGTKRRVRSIRAERYAPFVKCFRTCEAAVLPPPYGSFA